MEWNEYMLKVAELALDIKEIEDQIAGLYNLKKKKKEEIKELQDLMIDQCRCSGMKKEE